MEWGITLLIDPSILSPLETDFSILCESSTEMYMYTYIYTDDIHTYIYIDDKNDIFYVILHCKCNFCHQYKFQCLPNTHIFMTEMTFAMLFY